MGIVEFETLMFLALMVGDIVLGTINHVFIHKDNVSALAMSSIGKKCALAFMMIVVVVFSHLNDAGMFTADVDTLIKAACSTAAPIIVFLLMYELSSVLKHLYLMTGIDFIKMIPGMKSEIEHVTGKDDTK